MPKIVNNPSKQLFYRQTVVASGGFNWTMPQEAAVGSFATDLNGNALLNQ